MQSAVATNSLRRSAPKFPEGAASVAIAASLALRERLDHLARGAGMRVVPESSNHDVLLFGVDSDSSLPDSTGTLHVLTMRTAVCVFWAYKAAPVPPVSRLLQAGISAILPIDIDSAQFRAALSGVRHGLQVVHPLLLQRKQASRQSDSPEELTDREQQVLAMMADGLGNKEIAARLGISTHTVKFHISSILGRLGAGSRTEAVSIGMRTGKVLI